MTAPLPVVPEALVSCDRLHTKLTRRACAKRWTMANGRVTGAGQDALNRAKVAECAGCPIGEERAEAEKTSPSPPLSAFVVEDVPMPEEDPMPRDLMEQIGKKPKDAPVLPDGYCTNCGSVIGPDSLVMVDGAPWHKLCVESVARVKADQANAAPPVRIPFSVTTQSKPDRLDDEDLTRRAGERVVSIVLTAKQAALLDLLLDAGVYGDTDESACTYLLVEGLTKHFPKAFASQGFRP